MARFDDSAGRLPKPENGTGSAEPSASVVLVSEVAVAAGVDAAETAAVSVLDRLAQLATTIVEEYGGVSVGRGESITAEFADAFAAVRAAAEIQRRLLLLQRRGAEWQGVLLRVAVASGPGTRDAQGPAGPRIDLARRMNARAKAGQVFISRGVRDAIALETDIRCAWSGTVDIPSGRKEEVFEVLWNADERTPSPVVAATPGVFATPAVAASPAATPVVPPATAEIAAPASGPETTDLGPAAAATPTPAAVGAALDARYEILGQLGMGGMGVVYKARDRETGETLALKSLRSEVAEDPATMERFKNELRLARKITHKNVCRIHDFVRSEGTAYISMEFVEGETLRSVLARFGSMSVRKGIQIARQICSGLAEAHAEGIVHRDLKPENVMIDRRGNVKLMDFGIARSMQSGTSTSAGLAIGTPAYMAPEQAEGRPADARSDVYSLGLILYEMFAGVAAFRGETPLALALKQIRERPPSPREHDADIPEYLEQTILRCIEKSPSSRFQSIAELDDALGRQTLTPWSTPGALEGTEGLQKWFGAREGTLLVLGVVGLALLVALVGNIYPVTRLRLQADFGQAQSEARRYLRVLLPAAQPSQKARVWIDGRSGDDVQPTDPGRVHQDFAWEFRWRARGPGDALVRGYIQVDHEGKLRSFRRLDPVGGDPRLGGSVEALLARASDLSRSVLGFDPASARLRSTQRFDADGNAYVHFEWTATQPDDVGYRTAAVDLTTAGIQSMATGYSGQVVVPVPTQYWSDILGGFLFALVLLVVFLTRTVNVGAARLRRPLVISAVIGVWAATALPLLEGWLPQGDWPAHVILGLAYFALIFFVSAAGEDTLLSLWPQKIMTWITPLEGRWLHRRAAVNVVRGTLWGLSFLCLYVPITVIAAREGLRLRTFVLEWPQGSAWNPAAAFLIGALAINLAIVVGPIAVFMALLRRWLHAPWALMIAAAFAASFIYRQEVFYGEVFGAYVVFNFIGFAWFAWCFYETDLLGTLVAMMVFNDVVGLWALLELNLEVSALPFVVAFAMLAALPAFALLSLRQGGPKADPGTALADRA